MIFETNDRRICTFNNLKRTISASYSEHKRYRKKSELEFEGPQNQGVTFEMKFIAGHGVRPWSMVHKITLMCEQGVVNGIDEDYKEVWNHGELVSVAITVTAKEYL